MNQLMIYIYSNDFDAAIAFYQKFNFTTEMDDEDGNGIRRVRITHPSIGAIVALQNRHELLALSSCTGGYSYRPDVIFSIITSEYSEWCELAKQNSVVLEAEIVEPWGVWYYFRDPAGNLFCITNNLMC